MKLVSSLFCLLPLCVVAANAQLQAIVHCRAISTCTCFSTETNCTQGADAWLIGGSTIVNSEECRAWCRSEDVCAADADFSYECGADEDVHGPIATPWSHFANCSMTEQPGSCRCNSDTCSDTSMEDIFTDNECKHKCSNECGADSESDFSCTTSGAARIGVIVAAGIAVLLPILLM